MFSRGGAPNITRPLIPDISVLYGTQEFAFVEAAKSKNDTKELLEGGFFLEVIVGNHEQLLSLHPIERRSITVHGFLLSGHNCSPLQTPSLFGYVKLIKEGKTVQHPEMPQSFKAQITRLLAQVWQFRLAVEMVAEAMIASENESSGSIS